MNTQDLIVQRPSTLEHLLLLFHGVGSTARELLPRARRWCRTCPVT